MESVRLEFLGSGDAFGSGGRFQTCLHLSGAGEALLVDCGASSLVAMKRAGRRTRPLLIAGPPGVGARVEAAMEVFFPGSTGVQRKFEVRFLELDPNLPAPVGKATVTAFPVVHPSGAPASALRLVCGGRTITYSGDTEWTESLIEAARGADLFVCEAYMFERQVKYHVDYRTLATHADRTGAKRIILTHMGPDMLEHEAEARFERAHDGLVVTL